MQVITLDATFAATGQPRRLTTEPMDTIRGVTWARNGAFVIFGAIQGPLNELWRAGIDTDASAYRIEMAASGALFPATALSADRLVFTRGTVDEDVYAMEVGRPVRPVARSSVFDGSPRFHPTTNESRSVPAALARQPTSGLPTQTVHIRNSSRTDQDGGNARRPGLVMEARWRSTREAGPANPRFFRSTWSGASRGNLPNGRGDRRTPSWSRNAEWIYFSWDQGRGRDIWRVQRTGGAPERVTTTGSGLTAVESADGATLFYLAPRTIRIHEPTDAPLMAQSLAGGPPREVIPCVMGTAFPSASTLSTTFRAAPRRARTDVIPPYSSSTFQPARGARWGRSTDTNIKCLPGSPPRPMGGRFCTAVSSVVART